VKRIFIFPLILCLTSVFSLSAQEETKDLWEDVKKRAIVLNFYSEMTIPQQGSWSGQLSKITLPGRSVLFHMEGQDIKLQISLTPYIREDNSYLLVAQGQIWFTQGENTHYKTVVKSLIVKEKEALLYYPFGSSPNDEANFVVEITLRKLYE